MTRRMTTAEAVATVLAERAPLSKYRLGLMMQSTATSVNQWLKGTRMGADNAKLFREQFDIEVTDAAKTAPAKPSR
jgi:predicted transcriptional regulator